MTVEVRCYTCGTILKTSEAETAIFVYRCTDCDGEDGLVRVDVDKLRVDLDHMQELMWSMDDRATNMFDRLDELDGG